MRTCCDVTICIKHKLQECLYSFAGDDPNPPGKLHFFHRPDLFTCCIFFYNFQPRRKPPTEELIQTHSQKWDPPGPEQVICPAAWSQSPAEGTADSVLNLVHPASCTRVAPCQEARGGCRTRWQWSRPRNNWLSTRHPIIPCSHYVIPRL